MTTNLRQYARLPLSGEDSTAVLIVNRRSSISCQLTEMSIGGFGVVVPKQTQLAINDLVCLKTRGSDFIVRVTYQGPHADGIALGLKQVEEVPPNANLTSIAPRWMTTTFWLAAASSVLAATYCLTGWYELLPK